MNTNRSRARLALIVLPFVILALSASAFAGDVKPANKKAPDFTLKDAKTGKMVSMSDFKGKVVLVDFWATWCVPCKKAMTFYEKLYRKKYKEGFVVLAISIDKSEKKLNRFLKRRPVSFYILHDPGKLAAKKYGAFRVPTTVLIDRNGVIQNKYFGGGATMKKIITARVEELLK
ncbi:TlpA family protein disulfide reductase [bacterium]|nr:TlpA family protein disulfide reductase [bacterium]